MSNIQLNTDLIVEQLRKGNQQAIRNLYQLSFPECASFIKKNSGTHSDAEDFFQEALVVLYRKVSDSNFRLTSNIKTFLYGITRNLWLNELRKRSKSGLKLVMDEHSDKEYILTEEDQVEAKQEEEQKHQLIAKAIQTMQGNCKDVLVNFYFKKMSLREIAAAMGFTEQYAKKRRYKCMKSLKLKVRTEYAKLGLA